MKFTVKVAVTYHKEIHVSGADESEAEDNAMDVVFKWPFVEDAEIIETTEDAI